MGQFSMTGTNPTHKPNDQTDPTHCKMKTLDNPTQCNKQLSR